MVSINSFGYGGADSHIVLYDAYNYLRLRRLAGKHCTVSSPQSSRPRRISMPLHTTEDKPRQLEHPPRFLIWSSAEKEGMDRICQTDQDWWASEASSLGMHGGLGALMADLSFTLAQHRSHLQWRSFAVLRTPNELKYLQSHMAPAVKAVSRAPRLGFVFTGQGAQWYAMGRELLWYASFREELYCAQRFLQTLGCPWLVIGKSFPYHT
jgi:acyl transferase domain-containing protein